MGVWSRMWVIKTYVFCKGQNSQKPTLFVGFFNIPWNCTTTSRVRHLPPNSKEDIWTLHIYFLGVCESFSACIPSTCWFTARLQHLRKLKDQHTRRELKAPRVLCSIDVACLCSLDDLEFWYVYVWLFVIACDEVTR
jgi:hypothetical protein